jgi:hypothetical protein
LLSPRVEAGALLLATASATALTAFSSSSLKIEVCEATTLLNYLLNSITLNSASSPFFNFLPSSFSK